MKGIFVKATLLGTLFVFLKCTIICSAENEARLETDVTKSTQQAENCDCEGGTCEKEDGKLVCKCPPEYGLYPTIWNSYCTECDCGKGANCTFEYGYWTNTKKCICKEGDIFYAIKCLDPCAFYRCRNGGTCIVKNSTIHCECNTPFHGLFCQNDPCSGGPCENGGTCIIRGNSFKCICQIPYVGTTCETGPCSSTPCQNDGICRIENGAAKCFCKEPFTGENCEIRNDSCSGNPCQNGGSCFAGGNSFACLCKTPFSGFRCELDPTSYIIILIISVLGTTVVLSGAYSICQRYFRRRLL